MAYRSSSLPDRFPVGTKFVIESKPRGEGKAQVFKRYLEFPDGTFLRLPVLTKGKGSRKSKSGRARKSRSRH